MPPSPLPRRVLAAVVTALLGAATLPIASAQAQTADDRQAEVDALADRLEELRIAASRHDEAYAAALLDVERAQDAIYQAQRDVAAVEDEVTGHHRQLETYAIEAYIGGSSDLARTGQLHADIDDLAARSAYLEAASGSKQDVLAGLATVRGRLDTEIGRLAAAETAAVLARDLAAASLADAEQAVADEQALLDRLEGELADLLAAEEADRAADERRRAEATARRAAEAAAQGPPPPAPAASPDPPPPPPTITGGTPGAADAVALGLSLLGVPYTWAGSTPSTGFDCSGFTSYVWGQAGYGLPHSAAAQSALVQRLPLGELLPGDLVFYGWGSIHHVAIYIGDGQIVHAPGRGRSVRVDSIYYWDRLHFAGRLP